MLESSRPLKDSPKRKGKHMAEELTQEQKQRQAELKKKQEEIDAVNKARTGVGTRLQAGMTRGKGSMVISWEAFDEDEATRPKSLKEFNEVTGTKDEKTLLDYVITGYNDYQYTQASDPIAEHINSAWDDATQAQFRLVVRNYARLMGVSIDDAVAVIKPGVEKAYSAKASA